MERFFKVKEENPIYGEYFKWWNNVEPTKAKWKEFKKMVGIEASEFAPYPNLYIVPTENDLINFGRYLNKEVYNNGLRKFKKTSTIQKDWDKFVKNNIKLIPKPNIAFDFCFPGKTTTRLFHYENTVYCSVIVENNDDYDVPQGYEEIKGSEFYKIVELIENEYKSEENKNE